MTKPLCVFLLLIITSLHFPQSDENTLQNNYYKSEEVKFYNGKIRLSGTLTIPLTDGRHPAVILAGSSVARNRDYNNCGFDMFKDAADFFTRRGFEVLRFDVRGTGNSTGAARTPSASEMAGDIKAAVNFLRNRPEVEVRYIGLCGHGDGAAAAAATAASLRSVYFLIMMNGPVLRSNDSPDPALRYRLANDPAKDLAKVKCSVLATFGTLDLKVPAAENSAALERVFNKSGHRAWEIKIFPDANHILQKAATGNPDEYGSLPKEYLPGYLEFLSEWMNDLIPREERK